MLRATKVAFSALGSSPRVCILGGGAMGLSTALHLLQAPGGQAPKITVVERDFSFARNSAALSAGGVRTQFSLRENVECSLYGLEVFKKGGLNRLIRGIGGGDGASAADDVGVDVDVDEVDVQFMEGGYLFLASTEEGERRLKTNLRLQQELGSAGTVMMGPEELRSAFPYLNTDDLKVGCFSKMDGWLDPYSFLTGVKSALAPHVEYKSSLTDVRMEGGKISEVMCDGEWSAVDYVVNAAGANANHLPSLVPGAAPLPVEARVRTVFHFKAKSVRHPKPTEHKPPLTVDPSGVWYRSTGSLAEDNTGDFICGCTPPAPDLAADASSCDSEIPPAYDLWESEIWPRLYERCEAFGEAKVLNQWAGWYEYNTADQNGIVGFHPDCANMVLANGFSGHGLQQAPAVGRAVAELVEGGGFRSVDLGRFKFERFEREDELVFEEGIV